MGTAVATGFADDDVPDEVREAGERLFDAAVEYSAWLDAFDDDDEVNGRLIEIVDEMIVDENAQYRVNRGIWEASDYIRHDARKDALFDIRNRLKGTA